MAKTEIVAKTPKGAIGARRQSASTMDVVKNKGSKMTGKQTYRTIRRQQRIERERVKKTGGWIRQTGSAIAEASTPIASAITTQRMAAQYSAAKRSEADAALAKWQAQMSGNPSPDTGSSGATQGESSTKVTSAGSFGSLLDSPR